MSLSERLDAQRQPIPPARQAGHPVEAPEPEPKQSAAMTQLKTAAIATLLESVGSRLTDSSITDDQLRTVVRRELTDIIAAQQVLLTHEERHNLIRDIEDDALGLGPLQRLLDDPTVSEIMVNGHERIYVERSGRLMDSGTGFVSEQQLRRVIERIVSKVGRRIDESSPMVDARLQDGSRVNAVVPPLAVHGSSLTIRKFSDTPLVVSDLIRMSTMTEPLAEFLNACVEARLNILVSGGTGTGKTTLLNVLSSFIPSSERIVTIEDAVELKLMQDHVVTLESRPPNIEGKGEVTIRDLVRNSLRMRPDRLVVGEVRGGEALDMLQAMNTGHDGSLSTLHANTPRDTVSRLETLVLMAGMDLPLRAVREQISSAVDLVVQLSRLRDGTRRISYVTEVLGMEGENVVLQDIFLFDHAAGLDATGRMKGLPTFTGVRPRFIDKFEEMGLAFDQQKFMARVAGHR
ncbi:CpaF family protein [Aeromicrobium sp. CF3.5]|uniref:CpaF family protein n=1 Tax=Aeromicrobium sp. CF3.5 TaxID=3373078 RepID=UPI003EE73349